MGFLQNISLGFAVMTGAIPVDPLTGRPDFFGDEYRKQLEKLREYATGQQEKQLKTKSGQSDDNMIIDYLDLIIKRSVSMLVGQPIGVDFGEDKEKKPLLEYIETMQRVNDRWGILLMDAATLASRYGTGYLKLLPDTYVDNKTLYPRIIALNPRQMRITPDEHDRDKIVMYQQYYTVRRGDDTVEIREDTQFTPSPSEGDESYWIIQRFERSKTTGGKWAALDEPILWPYEFAPIIHWENLPEPESIYGESDIANLIDLQDNVNFLGSNIKRIIRYHAHPKTWGRGFRQRPDAKIMWGADEIVVLESENGELRSLEMSSDLSSSLNFWALTKAALFDKGRTVDLTVIKDKLGQVTNFGLRTLYQDSLSKLDTKRMLFGDMLAELYRRCLVLNGMEDAIKPKIVWSENVIPEDESEEVNTLEKEVNMGITSKQTAAIERGRDWEQEQERISGEKQAEGQANGDLGQFFLNGFINQ